MNPAVVGWSCSSLDVDADGVRRTGGEQHLDVVAEPDVLAALSDVEADERRALARVAAVDLQDDVFDPESRQPLTHRRLRVDRHVGPPFAHVRLGQHVLRLGRLAGRHVDAADVRTRDRQRRGDARVVQHLDEKEPRAALHQLRRRHALLHPHPALRADVHGHQHPAIEHALERGDRRRFVAHTDRAVERLHVGGGERLPEIPQRRLDTPRLLRQRLERDPLLDGGLLRGEWARRPREGQGGGECGAEERGHGALLSRATCNVLRCNVLTRATCHVLCDVHVLCHVPACGVLVPRATCRRATSRAARARSTSTWHGTSARRTWPVQHVAPSTVARCT